MYQRLFAAVIAGVGFAPLTAPAQDVTADDVIVTGTTATATKTATPLVDIPQSVTLLDRRRLEDRASRTLNEALAYIPGVNTGSYGFDPRFDAFFIRGFQATYTGVFRDGMRQLNSPLGLWRNEPYGIERLAVVRGPASVLYGASGAGGLVEVTSKRPRADRFAEVQGMVGSYDRYQLNADVSGPLGDSVALRVTGVARDSGTSLAGFEDDRYFLAPAATARLGDATDLTVLGEYMWSRTGASAAFYNDAGGVTRIPLSDPRFNDLTHRQWRAGYALEHRLGDSVSLHQNMRVQDVTVDMAYSYVIDPTAPVTRLGARAADWTKSVNLDDQLRAELTTGAVRHRLLIGLDYNDVRYRSAEGFGTEPLSDTYLARPPLVPTTRQRFSQLGVYAQEQVEAGALGLTAGVRHDWLDARTDVPDAPAIDRDDRRLSGRVGATLRVAEGVTPYLNWSTSFEPNVGLLLDATPARPTSARQYEGDVKWMPRTGVLLSAAAFDTRQRDGVVFDASTGINRQVQLDLRSRGAELEASARLTAGLDLTAAYALTDMRIRRGAAGTTGNHLSATPRHSGSLWADYAPTGGGFGLGAGVRFLGPSWGDDANVIRNRARTFADAVVHYDVPSRTPLRLQLNATNLLGAEPVTCAASFCYRDQGRTVLASARYRL
ncbi:TonB-dependent siderophore receptor [Sphingomonas sp. BK345]|uniref:TonB-dependent siderophore receptor n=1 Tax=Sphingomonas sp. BK345 TaxID=2586980 RepID=UPI001614FF11|nr:TonB-dependent siderophore receptor [Sphingomonas sp. BK345]MBB3471972.1 iron complex outermembrane receptor protein [Sphingomonas sp. BK345]